MSQQESNEQNNENVLQKATPGDLIRVKRFKGVYYHWAVYIGDGIVIERGTDERNKSSVSIRQTTFQKSVKNDRAEIYNYLDKKFKHFSDPKIVERAKQLLNPNDDYHLFKNNCEHFAVWCRYGLYRSEQVDKTVIGLNGADGLIGLMKGISGIVRAVKL